MRLDSPARIRTWVAGCLPAFCLVQRPACLTTTPPGYCDLPPIRMLKSIVGRFPAIFHLRVDARKVAGQSRPEKIFVDRLDAYPKRRPAGRESKKPELVARVGIKKPAATNNRIERDAPRANQGSEGVEVDGNTDGGGPAHPIQLRKTSQGSGRPESGSSGADNNRGREHSCKASGWPFACCPSSGGLLPLISLALGLGLAGQTCPTFSVHTR